MKKTKKIAAILATIALVSTSAISTFAANTDISSAGGNTSQAVKATIAAADPIYKVTVDWGALTYDFKVGKWDPDAATYAAGTWAPTTPKTTDKIKITNKSNVALTATLTPSAVLPGVTSAFNDDQGTSASNAISLDSADTTGSPVLTAERYLAFTGNPTTDPGKAASDVSLATITVTLS